MSRGRHRQTSALGRSLPLLAGGALVFAAVAALVASPDTLVVRSVGIAAVVAAIGMAVLLRQRDRAARAALQLSARRRLRAEERFEEQLAEAEYAAEVAEERAARFGRRLTAEKSRLAKAETEIARLLRERAVMVAEQALKEVEAAKQAAAAAKPKHPVTPAAFVRAASVMRQLERQVATADARRESAARAEVAVRPRNEPVKAEPAGAQQLVPAKVQVVPLAGQTWPQSVETTGTPATAERSERPAVGAAPARPVLPAGGSRQRPRPVAPARSSFSFFGRSGTAPAAPAAAVGDLADVIGDEAVAASATAEAETHTQAEPEVVDLTPHDETECLELSELRATN